MNNDEKFALITENLAEVIRPQLIHDVLAEGRPLKVYWGKNTRPPPLSTSSAYSISPVYKLRVLD